MKIYLLLNDIGKTVIGSTIKTPLIQHIKESGYRKCQGYSFQYKKEVVSMECGKKISTTVFCYIQEITIIHKGHRIKEGAKLLE